MELVLSSLLMLLAFLFLVFMILKTGDRSVNLPPGPWKLPLIGNFHQLVGSLPHHRLRNLSQEYGPLMYLQFGELPIVVVSSPEFAKEVTKTHAINFSSKAPRLAAKIMTYNSSGIIFSPYGDYWRQLRKLIVMEVLSMKKVESFRPIREEEVSDLINWIASKSGSVVNLTEKFYLLSHSITSKVAFGNKCKYQEEFISIAMTVIKLIGGTNIADLFPSIKFLQSICGIRSRLDKKHKQVDKIISNIIDERKKRRTRLESEKSENDECLVDVLLNVQNRGDLEFPITADNIKALIFEIFAAMENSAATLDWALFEMLKNPSVLKKAQAEVRGVFNSIGEIDESGIHKLKYLKLVIKETLRLHPSIPLLFPKEGKEKCKINGFDIPAKANVIVNAWAMGRDPEYWREPERFIPERFLDSSINYIGNNFKYIPFGMGKRICPGISFANAVIEFSLAMLLYHFDWKLPNGMTPEDLDMSEIFGTSVRRKHDLWIIPIPYNASPATEEEL